MKTLIPILGDQLSHDIPALEGASPATSVILMMEVDEETSYVRHHKAKIAFILSAMRHHAEDLRAAGWTVDPRLGARWRNGLLVGPLAPNLAA